jgi:uncharacterized protein (TIRG00374 family)
VSSTVRTFLSLLLKLLPWAITGIALYGAFRGIDWSELIAHLGGVNKAWLALSVILTSCSYLMRARRWQFLFPGSGLSYTHSLKVLFLGFFMNNILPARAGELVRAHMGARCTGQTRTLVLATIASERLTDGLTLSALFVVFCFHMGDAQLSEGLSYVALLFACVTLAVLLTLILRQPLLQLAETVSAKIDHKASDYLFDRLRLFLDGLKPLCSRETFPIVLLWSVLIWCIELSVYFTISLAFEAQLSLAICVLFMVTVNFSSLIPAAPGGIGVIEAIATSVLVSVGIPRELALTMVIAQHAIQYCVVGIPGALVLFTWKKTIRQLSDDNRLQVDTSCEPVAR